GCPRRGGRCRLRIGPSARRKELDRSRCLASIGIPRTRRSGPRAGMTPPAERSLSQRTWQYPGREIMPRIAIGEISHETNTFCPPTTLAMFKERHWDHGEEIIRRERGTRTYLGGMIEAGERLGATLIPTFAASTEPWGTITREAYDTMVGELVRGIQEAMAFLFRVLRREITPKMAIEALPLLIPASPSALEPARTINAHCHQWEQRSGMIDCVFFHGFSQTDIPEAGVTVVAVADGDAALAGRAAQAVAREVRARREAVRLRFPQPVEAVAEAVRVAGSTTPVVINEMSDNPGGGAPGDGTHLLRAMLAAGLTESAFAMLYDPEVADAAHRAGVGATLRVRLGGKHDRLHGDPVDLEVYVKSLTDGRFTLSTPMGRGSPMNIGRTARIAAGGLDIVVASGRTQVLDPGPFLLHGIDVARCRIVGLKSSAHFRAGFSGIAKHIVT